LITIVAVVSVGPVISASAKGVACTESVSRGELAFAEPISNLLASSPLSVVFAPLLMTLP
jgi:hypothetical protein